MRKNRNIGEKRQIFERNFEFCANFELLSKNFLRGSDVNVFVWVHSLIIRYFRGSGKIVKLKYRKKLGTKNCARKQTNTGLFLRDVIILQKTEFRHFYGFVNILAFFNYLLEHPR